jgi:uncharacterized SAM-binding protein YcdF (DUF218 family)
MLLDAIKIVGAPGSLTMLALACGSGVLVIRFLPHWQRLARLCLAVVFVVYVILGLPVTANAIAMRLPASPTLDAATAQRTVLLNVLDGDNRRGRLAEALRIYRLATPQLVIVSGDAWLEDALLQGGVPRARVLRTTAAGNTRAQVEEASHLVRTHPDAQVTLVASRLQMARIEALVRAAGLQVALAPSPIDTEPPVEGMVTFVPTYNALRVSRDAIYELAALRYYEHQGWIDRGEIASARAAR